MPQFTFYPLADSLDGDEILLALQDGVTKQVTVGELQSTASFTLPVATVGTLGGIKEGGDIEIDGSGTVTILDNSHFHTWGNITNTPTTLAGYGITDAAGLIHSHTWSQINNTPTTLAGYNITDAVDTSHLGGNIHIDWTVSQGTQIHPDNYNQGSTYVHPDHTGDVTSDGDGATVISANAVTLSKIQDIASLRFIGRISTGTGDPELLSIPQVKGMLDLAGTNTGDQTITLTGPVTGSGTGAITTVVEESLVDHDQLLNYVVEEHIDWTVSGASFIHPDNINQVSILQYEADIDHDALSGFELKEHIDWTQDVSSTYTFNTLNIPTVDGYTRGVLEGPGAGVDKYLYVNNSGEVKWANLYSGPGAVDHDKLVNFVQNEHIDWTIDQGTTKIFPLNVPEFTDSANGTVGASGGGTDKFLRADGNWVIPASGGSGSFATIKGYIDLTSATAQDVGEIPADADILEVILKVEYASDAATTVEVGDATNGVYMSTSENWPDLVGTYSSELLIENGDTARDVTATVSTPGTEGSAICIVKYSLSDITGTPIPPPTPPTPVVVSDYYIFQANFTDEDDTSISDYEPDIEVTTYSDDGPGTDQMLISGNALTLNNSSSGTIYAEWDLGATPPVAGSVICDVTDFTTGSGGPAIYACSTGGWEDSYGLSLWGGTLYLDKIESGSYTGLDTASFSRTDLETYEFKLEWDADSVRGYVNGELLVEASDSDLRGRYFGYYAYNSDLSSNPGQVLADNLRVATATGGFVEDPTTASGRSPLTNPTTIAAFLPATTGQFTFPAPYHTQGVRLTNSSNEGWGTNSLKPVGYSYWPISNNHVGQSTIKIVIGLDQADGGVSIIEYNKETGAITGPTPVFSPATTLLAEQFYWDGTDPDILYYPYEGSLRRLDTSSLPASETNVFEASDISAGYKVRQAHSSRDGTKHVMSYQNGSYSTLGAVYYNESTDSHTLFPEVGDYDEAQIDKGGDWLVIKDNVNAANGEDNRVVDLSDMSVRVIDDPDGAGGHSDLGYGWQVNLHNFDQANEVVLWDFSESTLSYTTVYTNEDWSIFAPQHLSLHHARSDIPIEDQFVVGSSADNETGVHADEIIAIKLDGSMDTLVIAPTMTDLSAGGGVDSYGKQPKANTDITGEYVFWTANMGTANLDLFMAKIPKHLLEG